jgi:phage baseplate assembly protein V
MGVKNILSDTDHARGQDTRFMQAVAIGRVTKIEVDDKRANVRVIMPDRKDHVGTPLITKPIPVMQVASTAKKSYAIPRIGTPVVLLKLANGTSDWLVVGSFYTKNDPPPVSDPMLDYVVYDDGSTQQFDANNGTLTWRLKGAIDIETDGNVKIKAKTGATVTIEGDADVLVKSDSAKVTLQSGTDVEVNATGEVKLTSAANIVRINGNIIHTGDMSTTGVHTDSLGFHVGGSSDAVTEAPSLLDRIAALEARVTELESRTGPRV